MILIHRLPKNEWSELAANAHMAIFGQKLPPTQERIDFALLAVHSETADPLAYVTCRELSPETLYFSYGGSFPPAKNTVLSWGCYRGFTDEVEAMGYTHIFTLIENTNTSMLRFASKMGYKIVGLRHVEGATMLEHLLELNSENEHKESV